MSHICPSPMSPTQYVGFVFRNIEKKRGQNGVVFGNSKEKVDMVEIDGMVVEACRKFIPQTACGMNDDPRFTLYIEDGVKFAKETKEKYDVVIVDSSEPMGPSTPLFGPEFYKDLFACMTDEGIRRSQVWLKY